MSVKYHLGWFFLGKANRPWPHAVLSAMFIGATTVAYSHLLIAFCGFAVGLHFSRFLSALDATPISYEGEEMMFFTKSTKIKLLWCIVVSAFAFDVGLSFQNADLKRELRQAYEGRAKVERQILQADLLISAQGAALDARKALDAACPQ